MELQRAHEHSDAHPPDVLLYDVNGVLAAQVVPQAVRCQDQKPIGRLQLPDGDGRPRRDVRRLVRRGAAEAREERGGVELEELHVAVAERPGHLRGECKG